VTYYDNNQILFSQDNKIKVCDIKEDKLIYKDFKNIIDTDNFTVGEINDV
jgi:hypothetical protein